MDRGKRAQFLVTFSVSLATLTMGVSSGWPTIVLPLFKQNATNIIVTENAASWMVAMSPLGFTAGSLLTRYVSDNLGRRAVVLASAAPFAAGTLFLIMATKGWILWITKFLWGFGTGMLSTVMTIYIVEISYKELRGTLNVVTRFMFNFGNLLIMCMGPFLSFDTLNYCLFVLPLVYFSVCWWIPESPYYYLKEGRIDTARKELTKLRKEDNSVLEDELATMKNSVATEMEGSSSVKELFTGKQYRKALVVAVGLKVTQILTGGMAIQQYLIVIVQESGLKMAHGNIAIVYGAVKFIVALFSSVLVDRVGRRPLLVYSFSGTGFFYTTVGIYFLFLEVIRTERDILSPYGIMTFISILLATVISNLGFNSVAGIVPAEIFPMNVKSIAMTFLNVLGGLLGFAIGRGYQLIKDFFGLSGVFFLFAFVTFCGAGFTYICVPETKGKSLVEIQVMMQGAKYFDMYGQTDNLDSNDVELVELNRWKDEEKT